MRFVCSMPSPPHPPWSFSSVLVLPYWFFFFQRPQRIAFSRLFNSPNKVLLVTAPRAFPFSQMPGVRFTVTLKVLTLTLTSTDPCNSQGNSHSSRQRQQLRTYLSPHLSVNIDCALGPYHAQCSLLGRGGENKVKFLSSKCSLSKSPTTNIAFPANPNYSYSKLHLSGLSHDVLKWVILGGCEWGEANSSFEVRYA